MSEDANPSQNLPAVQQRKAIVADAIPVFDTDRFEHYGRIAAVMARSSIVPATLREGDAVANCFQVVELADRWGYSPFAVAQCASIVHGKLMLEGKLVAAVLQSKLGMKLNHYFIGDWGKDDYRIFVTDAELSETQVEELRPHMKIHGVRMIDGSVGEWKTKEKGGAVKGNWLNQPDVQLVYRGDRTFARVYESAVMLGVITDDEMEDFSDRRLQVEAQQPALTDGPARRPRKPAAAPAATDVADEGSKPAADAPQADGEGKPPQGEHDDTHDAEFEDAGQANDAERQADGEKSTGAEDVKQEGEQGGAEASATTPSDANTQSPTNDPEPTSAASSPSSETEATRAPAGELYCLNNDHPDDAGRVPTYKDGLAFSKVKLDAKARPPFYDMHPLSEDDDAGDQQSVDATPGSTATSSTESPPETGMTEHAAVLAEAYGALDTKETYLAAKQVMKNVAVTDAWKAADKPTRDHLRSKLWDVYVQLREEGRETMAPYEDITLMQLFLQFGATTEQEVDDLWGRFYRGIYKTAAETDKTAFGKLMHETKARLKGGAAA